MEKLPHYKITVDEEYNYGSEPLGADMYAITATPAIILKGQAYNEHKKLCFTDGKKYRITAPAIAPKDDIYRNDDMGEYTVEFTPEEIEAIHKDFMQKLSSTKIFNLEHQEGTEVPAFLFEAWIVGKDPKADKSYSEFGLEQKTGTLMFTLQFTDVEYYEKAVEEGRTGLSVEGFLGLKLSNQINKYSMKLPDGEHVIEGKIYVVKDGEVVEVKDVEEVAMAEETVEETEVVEEEMAEEVKEEVKEEKVEMAVDPAADSEAILAIVAPMIEEKIAEVLQVIADLKNELSESVEVEPTEEVEMQLSAHHKFSNVVNFLKTNG